MWAAKLTSKNQVTIPLEVCCALGLKSKDVVSFEIMNDKVVISKVSPFDYYRALSDTLNEWNSSADDEAYRNL